MSKIRQKSKTVLYGTLSISLSVFTLPFFAEAQIVKPRSFKDLVGNIIDVLNGFITLTMGLATLYFLWGIIRYMTQYGDEQARSESVKTITYGLIALFVMVAIWGIVTFLRVSLLGGVGGTGIPQF